MYKDGFQFCKKCFYGELPRALAPICDYCGGCAAFTDTLLGKKFCLSCASRNCKERLPDKLLHEELKNKNFIYDKFKEDTK